MVVFFSSASASFAATADFAFVNSSLYTQLYFTTSGSRNKKQTIVHYMIKITENENKLILTIQKNNNSKLLLVFSSLSAKWQQITHRMSLVEDIIFWRKHRKQNDNVSTRYFVTQPELMRYTQIRIKRCHKVAYLGTAKVDFIETRWHSVNRAKILKHCNSTCILKVNRKKILNTVT